MILVDTNILIDYFRSSAPSISHVFQNNQVALCGVVYAEFLQGTKSKAEVAWIKNLLKWMSYIDIERSDWEEVGFMLRTLREGGVSVPLADAIIAHLAIKISADVWTIDRHFPFIKALFPKLRLFKV